MSESGRRSGPRRFVVDTNVFVAAIRPFSRSRRKASMGTRSLALLLRLINDADVELFANLLLLDEYKRLGEELDSETSDLILGQLTARTHEVGGLDERAVARCRPYLPPREDADVLHAATCLQLGAVLITNDKDFDRIRDSRVIEVWSISEAIERLSGRR
jgi:predicted nucleic acid-binding protein